mmetsp:Transcript_15203/g.33001  ORF Transcript_15203/g.33001 Transcript_15203/m.33001 type:complete len:83 (-) Transcript_15203:90-338(-)
MFHVIWRLFPRDKGDRYHYHCPLLPGDGVVCRRRRGLETKAVTSSTINADGPNDMEWYGVDKRGWIGSDELTKLPMAMGFRK